MPISAKLMSIFLLMKRQVIAAPLTLLIHDSHERSFVMTYLYVNTKLTGYDSKLSHFTTKQ
jgi:hypothetical protein